jgi:hypothetical protein
MITFPFAFNKSTRPVLSDLLVYLDAGNPESYSGVPENGLLFHYDPSNSNSYPGSGTALTDLSSYGNEATLEGGVTFSSDIFTLDGTDDYIDLPSGFSDFSNGLSFFAVANFGVASDWERLFDFGNGASSNNILFARQGTTDDLVFEIYNGSTSRGLASVTNGVLNSTLAFYGVTIDGTSCRIYRNGALLSTISYPYLPNDISRTNNYIGRSNWSADNYFETQIGPIGMYNRVLSNAEMNSIYNYYTSVYTSLTETTTWNDLQGNYNGTLVSGPTYDSGNEGSIVTDGVNDYIRLDQVAGTGTATQSFTYEIWVNPSDTDGNIMSMSQANPQDIWNMPPIAASSSRFRGKIWQNNYLNADSTYTQGEWYQVVLVWNYGNSTQSLYVNGALNDSQSSVSYISSGVDNYIFLGQTNPGADDTGNFAGKYGIVRLYDRALTPSEVLTNFNSDKSRYNI